MLALRNPIQAQQVPSPPLAFQSLQVKDICGEALECDFPLEKLKQLYN